MIRSTEAATNSTDRAGADGGDPWRVPANIAFATGMTNRARARWPNRSQANRLEPECWPEIQPSFQLSASQEVFTIGSCFARNIEEYLHRLGFTIPTLDFSVPESEWPTDRPNGILNKYTPPAIYQELEWVRRYMEAGAQARAQILEEPLLELGPDLVVDLELGGHATVSRARAIERRQQVAELFQHAFTADVVTVTFGLVECWYDTIRQRYIQDAPVGRGFADFRARFEFHRLHFGDAYSWAKKTFELLQTYGKPEQRYLITVSPVPLQATFTSDDVITANMYSKCVLRAVAEEIRHEFRSVEYFPSFETVMLTRRQDIWQNDLIHPTDQFVGKIVGRLVTSYSVADGKNLGTDGNPIAKIWALLDGNEIDEAINAVLRLRSSTGDNPELDIIEGVASIRRGDHGNGTGLLANAIGSISLGCFRLMTCAKALEDAGAHDIARGVWDRVAASPDADLNSMTTLMELARAANRVSVAGHGEYADRWIKRVLALGGDRPSMHQVHQIHALILQRKGDLHAAAAEFRRVLARQDSPMMRYHFAVLLEAQKNLEEALAQATAALRAEPTHPLYGKLVDKLRAAVPSAVGKGHHRGIVGGLWDEIGKLQLDFLQKNGLSPGMRLIDIGCGCLRGGVHFVDFLDPGNYFGIDMSAELLQAGYDIELNGRELCKKLPRSNLICNAEFDFSELATTFDMAVAQSLFAHLPASTIELCLSRLAPRMRPQGVLFATFFIVPDDHPAGAPFTHPHGVRTFDDRDPYHYRFRQIRHLCEGLPWRPELVGEWGHPRDEQMVSLRRSAPDRIAAAPDVKTRALEIERAASLPAGAAHYRAYVGPPDRYDFMSASQFALLFTLGLREQQRVLDFGCGSLRLGRLLIPFLRPDRYFGIDPNKWLIEDALANELGRDILDCKRPTFGFNSDFHCDVFDTKFDYIVAQSILTHCGPDLAGQLLHSMRDSLEEGGKAIFTFIKDAVRKPQPSGWTYPSCVSYQGAEMSELCQHAGLCCTEIPWYHPGGTWFVAARSPQHLPSPAEHPLLRGAVLFDPQFAASRTLPRPKA